MTALAARDSSSEMDVRQTQTVEEMDAVDPRAAGRGRLFQLQPFEAGRDPVELTAGEEFTIGRANACEVALPDSKVSRRHATVGPCGKSFLLTDLGSTNGTLVNGRRVDVHLLVSGDRVRVGNHVFKYLDTCDPENAYHLVVEDRIARDPLTGAYNKAVFDRELAAAARRGAWLITLDVDRFKSVNDAHGHPVGDEVLRETVRRLTEGLGEGASLARVGGEEFAVILPMRPGEDARRALALAEAFRRTLCGRPFPTEAGELAITASFGVGCGGPGFEPEALAKQADAALYEAKRGGRNRVVVAAE